MAVATDEAIIDRLQCGPVQVCGDYAQAYDDAFGLSGAAGVVRELIAEGIVGESRQPNGGQGATFVSVQLEGSHAKAK